jgi:hypothetical protein
MIRRSPSPSVAPPGLFRIPTSYPGFPSVTRGYSPSPFQGSLASPSGNPVKPRPSKNPPAERRLDLDAIKPGATSRRGELPIDRRRNLLSIEPGLPSRRGELSIDRRRNLLPIKPGPPSRRGELPIDRRRNLLPIEPGAPSRRAELSIDRCRNLMAIEPGPGGAAENSPGQAKRARGSRSTSTRSPGRATEIICPHYPVSPIRPNSMRYHACQTQLTHTWQLPRT